MIRTLYGDGGFCEFCDSSHDHPLYNIIEQEVLPEPEETPESLNRKSALAKLAKLGLNEEEVSALLNGGF